MGLGAFRFWGWFTVQLYLVDDVKGLVEVDLLGGHVLLDEVQLVGFLVVD